MCIYFFSRFFYQDILSAGGASSNFMIKQMEAKLQKHLRNADIDMAFMVMLQHNIQVRRGTIHVMLTTFVICALC